MPRLFHLSVFIISFLLFFSGTSISYQQTDQKYILKNETSKADEEKYKKIEAEIIRINREKDESVKKGSAAIVITALILSCIFYYFGNLKKCPSCRNIFSEKTISATPVDDTDEKKGKLYKITCKCPNCGNEWEKIDTKMPKTIQSDDII